MNRRPLFFVDHMLLWVNGGYVFVFMAGLLAFDLLVWSVFLLGWARIWWLTVNDRLPIYGGIYNEKI